MDYNTTPHHNRYTTLFPEPPWWASARRELLDFMVQGKINGGRHTNHPAGRHSIRTNQCQPPPSPHFFTGWMPFLPPNQQCQSTDGKHGTINRTIKHNIIGSCHLCSLQRVWRHQPAVLGLKLLIAISSCELLLHQFTTHSSAMPTCSPIFTQIITKSNKQFLIQRTDQSQTFIYNF